MSEPYDERAGIPNDGGCRITTESQALSNKEFPL
jgi:hypothetical protein